jgi:hypothetical protein
MRKLEKDIDHLLALELFRFHQHTYGASSDKHELAAERTEGRGNQFNL